MKISTHSIHPLALTWVAILIVFLVLPGHARAAVVAIPNPTIDSATPPGQSLDEGTFSNDYQGTANTRGFWFTAPENFTITGLMVPTTVGTDVQNVEIFTLTSAPATFGASTPSSQFNVLGYYAGVSGTSYISTNFSITTGQVVCILGAQGTTTMNNSYATTNTYASSIGGMSVTLSRLLYQGNLNAGAAPSVSTAATNVYSPVSLLYVVPEPSTWALLGAGTVGLGLALRRRSLRA